MLKTLLLFIAVLLSDYSHACSCSSPSLEEEFQSHEMVLLGKVEKIDEGHTRTIHFVTERSWKGAPAPSVTFTTPKSPAACGFSFVKGEKYLVFVTRTKNQLSVNACSRTGSVKKSQEVISELDKITPRH